jgi:hypothetical protein
MVGCAGCRRVEDGLLMTTFLSFSGCSRRKSFEFLLFINFCFDIFVKISLLCEEDLISIGKFCFSFLIFRYFFCEISLIGLCFIVVFLV